MKPNHGVIKEIKEADAYSILAKNHFAHLACHVKDDLYLVPISYAFEGGYIYSHAQNGKKIQMMRDNHKVCVQVEEVDDFFHWKSVIAWGEYEELKGQEAESAMRSLVRSMSAGGPRRSDLEIYFESQLEAAIIYRIKVKRITGRYENEHISAEPELSL